MDDTPTVELKRYLDELCRDHAAMSLSEQRPDQRIVVDAIDLRLPATTDSYPSRSAIAENRKDRLGRSP
jgi:hypothetical protein